MRRYAAGGIALDEPTDLPDGTSVELMLTEDAFKGRGIAASELITPWWSDTRPRAAPWGGAHTARRSQTHSRRHSSRRSLRRYANCTPLTTRSQSSASPWPPAVVTTAVASQRRHQVGREHPVHPLLVDDRRRGDGDDENGSPSAVTLPRELLDDNATRTWHEIKGIGSIGRTKGGTVIARVGFFGQGKYSRANTGTLTETMIRHRGSSSPLVHPWLPGDDRIARTPAEKPRK